MQHRFMRRQIFIFYDYPYTDSDFMLIDTSIFEHKIVSMHMYKTDQIHTHIKKHVKESII